MDGRQGSKGALERGQRLWTSGWVWYLTTGAALAVTRVSLLVWLNHRLASHTSTETDYFLARWLYPEAVVSIFWNSLVASHGTKYYLAWGSLVTVGSFVMATPILLARQVYRSSTARRNVAILAGMLFLLPLASAVLSSLIAVMGTDLASRIGLPQLLTGIAVSWVAVVYPHPFTYFSESAHTSLPVFPSLWSLMFAVFQWLLVATALATTGLKRSFWRQVAVTAATVVAVGMLAWIVAATLGVEIDLGLVRSEIKYKS